MPDIVTSMTPPPNTILSNGDRSWNHYSDAERIKDSISRSDISGAERSCTTQKAVFDGTLAELASTERFGVANLQAESDSKLVTERSAASTRDVVREQTNHILTQNEHHFHDLAMQNRIDREALNLQIVTNNNAAALAGLVESKSVALAFAEARHERADYACQIKELIREKSCDLTALIKDEHVATRKQVTDLHTADLRDKLDKLQTAKAIQDALCNRCCSGNNGNGNGNGTNQS